MDYYDYQNKYDDDSYKLFILLKKMFSLAYPDYLESLKDYYEYQSEEEQLDVGYRYVRHFYPYTEVEELLKKYGFYPDRYSEFSSHPKVNFYSKNGYGELLVYWDKIEVTAGLKFKLETSNDEAEMQRFKSKLDNLEWEEMVKELKYLKFKEIYSSSDYHEGDPYKIYYNNKYFLRLLFTRGRNYIDIRKRPTFEI